VARVSKCDRDREDVITAEKQFERAAHAQLIAILVQRPARHRLEDATEVKDRHAGRLGDIGQPDSTRDRGVEARPNVFDDIDVFSTGVRARHPSVDTRQHIIEKANDGFFDEQRVG
jgi:hypothetical protein